MKNKFRLTAGRGATSNLPVMLSIPTDTKGGGVMTRAAPVRLGKIWLLSLVFLFFFFTNPHGLTSFRVQECRGEDTYSDSEIVNAIYKAEGGSKAKVPYGILSVKVKDRAEARQVCFNTVRNNKKRFAKQKEYSDFIEFLGSRYCPMGCENDNGSNRFWVKNVKGFLTKKRGENENRF